MLRNDQFDVEKIGDWLAKTNGKLKEIFEQYIKNNTELNVESDLRNLDESQIIKQLIKKSNFNRNDIENIFTSFGKSFIKILALSKKNNFPLLILIIDNFNRYCVANNDRDGEKLVSEFVEEFITKFEFHDDTQQQDVKKLIDDVIKDFFYRIGKYLASQTASRPLIDDDPNDYIECKLCFDEYLMQDENEEFWLKNDTYPIQIDFWIIPRKTTYSMEDNDDQYKFADYIKGGQPGEDDDDDDDDKCDNMEILEECVKNATVDEKIGDIAEKLGSHKIEYYAATMKKEFTASGFGQHFNDFLEGKNVNTGKRQEFMRNHRYIVIYDRRNDKLYIFKAIKGFDELTTDRLMYQYQSLYLSSKSVLPNKYGQKVHGNKGYNHDIGLFDTLCGSMFGFSYHLQSEDTVRVYWCSQGTPCRFFNNDMIKIWPTYFKENKTAVRDELKEQIEKSKSFSDKELNIDDGKSADEDLMDIDDLIERMSKLKSKWLKEVEITIAKIKEDYDGCDLTDVKEDINDNIDDSDIMGHLNEEMNDKERVTQFKKALLRLFVKQRYLFF